MNRRLIIAGFLLAAMLLPAACQSTRSGSKFTATDPASANAEFKPTLASDPIDPAWLKPSTAPFRLGAGDKLEIEIIGDLSTRATTKVGVDGKIYYYLLPGLSVGNLTLVEAKALLEKELLTYVRYPSVSIALREIASQRVWVLGRLNTPGVYPLTGPMTIIDVVARAGGLFSSRFSGTTEELADLQHSTFVRNGKPIAVDFHKLLKGGDMSQNIYLQPDDYIYLPSALSREVQVLGAVLTPRPIGFMDQVTLVSAFSTAGGAAPGAQLSEVAIVRGSLSKPSVAIVDLTAILAGKKPDIKLEPRDIVYVPTRRYESLSRLARQVVNTFVQTVSANEGSRAVNPSAAPVGVNVGLQ